MSDVKDWTEINILKLRHNTYLSREVFNLVLFDRKIKDDLKLVTSLYFKLNTKYLTDLI